MLTPDELRLLKRLLEVLVEELKDRYDEFGWGDTTELDDTVRALEYVNRELTKE